MSAYVDILLAAIWLVVGSVALVYLARRFFHEPRRAEAVAAAVVVAFVAGAIWSNATHASPAIDAEASGAPAAQIADTAAQQNANGPLDVSDKCRAVLRSPVAAGGFGAIDTLSTKNAAAPVAQGAVVSGASALVIHGWGGDISTNAPAEAVCLVVDGHVDPAASSRYFQDRSDVAAAFHKDALVRSGFEIDVPPHGIPQGPHRISVAMQSSDGTLALTRTSWNVIVR